MYTSHETTNHVLHPQLLVVVDHLLLFQHCDPLLVLLILPPHHLRRPLYSVPFLLHIYVRVPMILGM